MFTRDYLLYRPTQEKTGSDTSAIFPQNVLSMSAGKQS